MKLLRFTQGGQTRLGKLTPAGVVDLGFAGLSMRALIADLDRLRPALEAATGPAWPLDAVRLECPLPDARKFLGIGMNYAKHAEEARQAGIPVPTSQLWFNKQVSCLNGPHDPIVKWQATEAMDYEVELAAVIGRPCRHVRASEARAYVAGYMVANDVSARDWLKKSPTFTLGKSFDTYGPVGPWITTDDEVADPLALSMKLWVNGELRQDHPTDDMIYDLWAQIEYLSTVMTLEPGDILCTGTPSGIGAPTGRFLKPGDLVVAEA
jgi:2-keto-4-pentenoate hydratase/2-oxohepta-3-ene-1,7-dioic acid hydratase in catechol pathway